MRCSMVDNCVDVRIGWIDWAKFLCMFLVILGHCHVDDSGRFVVQYIYSFHMMFFFFLSGLLCKRNLCLVSLKKDIRYIIFLQAILHQRIHHDRRNKDAYSHAEVRHRLFLVTYLCNAA